MSNNIHVWVYAPTDSSYIKKIGKEFFCMFEIFQNKKLGINIYHVLTVFKIVRRKL